MADTLLDQLLVEALVGGGVAKLDQLVVEALVDFQDLTAGAGSPRVTQLFAEARVGKAPADRRVTQLFAEARLAPKSDLRVTQLFAEARVRAITPFERLLLEPVRGRVYLIDARPYDLVSKLVGRETFSQFSRRPWYDDRIWKARVLDALSFQETIFASSIGVSGSFQKGFGEVRIRAENAELDPLFADAWDGREVRVLVGEEDSPFEDFAPVFVGKAQDVTWDPDHFSIGLRDAGLALDVEAQQTTYEGDWESFPETSLEGPASIAGLPKPLCLGLCRNVPLTMVNQTLGIFQVHDGPIRSVLGAFSGGNPLTSLGDVGASITDATIPGIDPDTPTGAYVTDLSRGLLRMDFNPDASPYQGKVLTADVEGAADATFLSTQYPRTAAELIRYLVQDRRAVMANAELDLGAFDDFAIDAPQTLGLYIGTQAGVTLRLAVNALLDSVLGWMTFDRLGRFVVGQLRFRDAAVRATLGERHLTRIARVRTEVPPRRYGLRYHKNYTVSTKDQMAVPEVVGERYVWSLHEFQSLRRIRSTTIASSHPLSGIRVDDTLIDDRAQAEAEQERRAALFQAERHLYELEVVDHQFALRPGDTIRLQLPRFGLDAGRLFVVLGITENTSTAKTGLTVWG